MKAQLTRKSKEGNWRKYDTKEIIAVYAVAAIKNDKIINPITAKFYMGRSSQASVVYCVLWVNTKDKIVIGHGQAGGGGYHKQSAALEDAIYNAGIDLDEHIGGLGNRAIEDALIAIAKDIHELTGELQIFTF